MRKTNVEREKLLIFLIRARLNNALGGDTSGIEIKCTSMSELKSLRLKLYRFPQWLQNRLMEDYKYEEHEDIKDAFDSFSMKVNEKDCILSIIGKIDIVNSLHTTVKNMYNDIYRLEDIKFKNISE